MKELNQTELELLKIAYYIADNGRYAPGTDGMLKSVSADKTYLNPKDIKLIFDELAKEFNLL